MWFLKIIANCFLMHSQSVALVHSIVKFIYTHAVHNAINQDTYRLLIILFLSLGRRWTYYINDGVVTLHFITSLYRTSGLFLDQLIHYPSLLTEIIKKNFLHSHYHNYVLFFLFFFLFFFSSPVFHKISQNSRIKILISWENFREIKCNFLF